MKIAFNLDIEDWVAFQNYYRKKKAPIYRMLIPLLILSGVLLIIINIIYLSYQDASPITLISGFLLLGILYLFYLKQRSSKSLRKMAIDLKSKNPDAFGSREMEFDDKGIHIQSLNTNKFLTWEEMSHFEEDKDYYYLFSDKGIVYIIPKRKIYIGTHLFKSMLSENFSKKH